MIDKAILNLHNLWRTYRLPLCKFRPHPTNYLPICNYSSLPEPVGQLNENPVHKYELLVFNGIENEHLLYPLNSPFRINIWGGGRNVHYRFYRKRGFLVPPPLPPLSDRFCKKSEKKETYRGGREYPKFSFFCKIDLRRGFYRKRGFLVPPPGRPYRVDFTKNQER